MFIAPLHPITPRLLITSLLLLSAPSLHAVSLVLGPGGAASLYTDAAGGETLFSYSISGSNLSVAGWNSLSEQGYAFNQSQANSSQLAEIKTDNGLYISQGSYLSIGTPFGVIADTNGDGSVTFSDFLVLSENFETQTEQGAALGDFNGNGLVDFSDFELLSGQFGLELEYNFIANSVAGKIIDRPSEVPVPAAAWLFGSAIIGVVGVKRKRAN
ncbi:dockerin type I domain-containing protein [Oceanicoccus sagamiensis]|uniref:EF-hand domain-containing protein n=1 Tax=Oceanicoccus sagamiensis TaxID=716816 RepID=A0A1X9NLI6_9GAMM|nr:dockerin type I domain-containing protein [Oceanicoccus sagamiensis]ARN74803.1 hypothetical protein BST96_12140 [Oceanicoccus sagamiensis]